MTGFARWLGGGFAQSLNEAVQYFQERLPLNDVAKDAAPHRVFPQFRHSARQSLERDHGRAPVLDSNGFLNFAI